MSSNENAPYSVLIQFSPKRGFIVSVAVAPGEWTSSSPEFLSLLAATEYARKHLSRAGYTVSEGGCDSNP